MAQAGMSVPTYAYALNNPLYWVDLNGLDVTNSSGGVMWVKPETGTKPIALRPGEKYVGPQDGFTHPDVPNKVFKTVNNIDAVCKPGGKVDTSGGNIKEKAGQLINPLLGSTNPILHINYGPPGRGEAQHVRLWDPIDRWNRP